MMCIFSLYKKITDLKNHIEELAKNIAENDVKKQELKDVLLLSNKAITLKDGRHINLFFG